MVGGHLGESGLPVMLHVKEESDLETGNVKIRHPRMEVFYVAENLCRQNPVTYTYAETLKTAAQR